MAKRDETTGIPVDRLDRRSARRLVDEWVAPVYGLVLRITRDLDAAAAATVEAFRRLATDPMHLSGQDAEPVGTRLAWHARAAAFRRAGTVRGVDAGEGTPRALETDESRRIRKALDGVQPAQLEAVERAFFAGLPISGVSDASDVDIAEARTRLRLGARALARDLESASIDDGHADAAAEYALGILPLEQSLAFEQRLAFDESLRRDVRAVRAAIATMALAIPVEPPPTVRERAAAGMVAAADVDRAVAAPRRRATGALLAVALLAAAAAAIWWLTRQLADARELAAAAEVRVAVRDLAIAERDSLLQQLADPSVASATLASATGTGTMRLFIDRSRRQAHLSAVGLDSLADGRSYQLWFFTPGATSPAPSVTFNARGDRTAWVRAIQLPAGVVSAAAVSIEPGAGSASPTTPSLFASEIAFR